jgi:hypothetical protein
LKFLAGVAWLGFPEAILLIVILGCCSVGRAWLDRRLDAFYICVQMFGENGALARIAIWSAALTQRVRVRVSCRQIGKVAGEKRGKPSLHFVRRSTNFHHSSVANAARIECFAIPDCNS